MRTIAASDIINGPTSIAFPTYPRLRVSAHLIMNRIVCTTAFAVGILLAGFTNSFAQDREADSLAEQFTENVLPFVQAYCSDCHSETSPEADFDLSPYSSFESVVDDLPHWNLVSIRVGEAEMPPEDGLQPTDQERKEFLEWIEAVKQLEVKRRAGDPGIVLPRRLNNAEFDYSIYDLTGVDIQPTKEFPIDPANEAGFDNSGESLAMTPALLSKYINASQHVANHLVLLPDGITFSSYPTLVYSDRDKWSVNRIVDFYKQQPTSYSDYFYAAWQFQNRQTLQLSSSELSDIADSNRLSSKYLALIWEVLHEQGHSVGPIAKLQRAFQQLPTATEDFDQEDFSKINSLCEALGDWVTATREEYRVPEPDSKVRGFNPSQQALIIWKNKVLASNRRVAQYPEALQQHEDKENVKDSIDRFCEMFPDEFYVSERGRMFLEPKNRNKGRLLNAGFHLMVGYFRDDQPLYDLILDTSQQQELDQMWEELKYVTRAPIRQLSDFIYFERAEGASFFRHEDFDFAREDFEIATGSKLAKRLGETYVRYSQQAGHSEETLEKLETYFAEIEAEVKHLDETIRHSQSTHLTAIQTLAEQAWRRPLTENEKDELILFYQLLRDEEQLSHEDAIRDVFVSILMSPHFCYHVLLSGDAGSNDTGSSLVPSHPIEDFQLASRLSFFLWSSIPDQRLLDLAKQNRLSDPSQLAIEVKRMLADPKSERLATEFGGNWLEFRRFEQHTGVNRERFPEFDDELQVSMYQEPIHFLSNLIQNNESITSIVKAEHTYVNGLLAEHYGMPSVPDDAGWVRIEDASEYGRGGVLPMSVFLTQNSPGLRTSPVKRGYWVVRRILGQRIPPPPPNVPELPADEKDLGDLSVRDVLATHRENKSCSVCHEKFDSFGISFEGFGPIGEKRQKDMGGRAIDSQVEFPNGTTGEGVDGLRDYLMTDRKDDFVDNFCRKLLAYALGRSLILSDEPLIDKMKQSLAQNEYRFHEAVQTVVRSPQFLNRRTSPVKMKSSDSNTNVEQ